jgi:hypothetical protein
VLKIKNKLAEQVLFLRSKGRYEQEHGRVDLAFI